MGAWWVIEVVDALGDGRGGDWGLSESLSALSRRARLARNAPAIRPARPGMT